MINAASTANFTVKDYAHTEKTQSTEERSDLIKHPLSLRHQSEPKHVTFKNNKAVYTVSTVLNNRLSEDLR